MREHVVAASKAMRNGDWKKARDYIINDKMNGKVGTRDLASVLDVLF
jgi:translation initiation factor 3 subunit C